MLKLLKKNKYLIIVAIVVAALGYYYWTNHMEQFAPVNLSQLDADQTMSDNPYAYGTTDEEDLRWENLSVRPESQGAPGHTHGCKCGYPGKRTLDATGSHHQLQHVCAPCDEGQSEPVQLGHWWTRKDCADPSSRGLNVRPYCTNCGN